jgi:hypothetical protein
MDQLRDAWQTFVQHETNLAVQRLQQDGEGRNHVRSSERNKADSNQRHLGAHRTKSRSWATLVTSIETTRFHAARQDFTDHNAFVCNEWEKQQVELIRQLEPAQLAEFEIWSLDTTEGPARLRKKLTASIKARTVPQNQTHKPNLSRTFGVSSQPSNQMGVREFFEPESLCQLMTLL